MLTYQDFLKETENKSTDALISFVEKAIKEHRSDPMVKIANIADEYDAQQNTTIMTYTRIFYTFNGRQVMDQTSSNNKIASNFFHRLNVQRNTYLLGNGIEFAREDIKEKLGKTCTIMDSRGAIAGENTTLICYISYFELQALREIISRNKGTFSTVSTIDEILR